MVKGRPGRQNGQTIIALTLSKEQITALRARLGAACVSEHHTALQHKARCAGTHLGSQTERG